MMYHLKAIDLCISQKIAFEPNEEVKALTNNIFWKKRTKKVKKVKIFMSINYTSKLFPILQQKKKKEKQVTKQEH